MLNNNLKNLNTFIIFSVWLKSFLDQQSRFLKFKLSKGRIFK